MVECTLYIRQRQGTDGNPANEGPVLSFLYAGAGAGGQLLHVRKILRGEKYEQGFERRIHRYSVNRYAVKGYKKAP